jgi:hypothetical protein
MASNAPSAASLIVDLIEFSFPRVWVVGAASAAPLPAAAEEEGSGTAAVIRARVGCVVGEDAGVASAL